MFIVVSSILNCSKSKTSHDLATSGQGNVPDTLKFFLSFNNIGAYLFGKNSLNNGLKRSSDFITSFLVHSPHVSADLYREKSISHCVFV